MVELIMNTIAKRKDLMDDQMQQFEKGRDMAFVAGFYASVLKMVATDKPKDFEFVMKILNQNSVPEKYQK